MTRLEVLPGDRLGFAQTRLRLGQYEQALAAAAEFRDIYSAMLVTTFKPARDANRRLLSALRREERRTRLRAEWTGDGHVHRLFDYVPKSTRPMP